MPESDFTNLRIRTDELESLREAAASRFGDPNRISFGAMVRLLSEEYMEGSA